MKRTVPSDVERLRSDTLASITSPAACAGSCTSRCVLQNNLEAENAALLHAPTPKRARQDAAVDLRGAGVAPDVYSFNAAISACEKGGQWERALSLLDEMRSAGVEPDVYSFNAALLRLSGATLPPRPPPTRVAGVPLVLGPRVVLTPEFRPSVGIGLQRLRGAKISLTPRSSLILDGEVKQDRVA